MALSSLLLIACAATAPHTETMKPGMRAVKLIGPDGTLLTIAAEIADTPEEREQGLMYRQGLAENEGMLFVFNNPQKLSFWMKNTLIPLDVLFFDTEGRFLSSQTMKPCTGDPCDFYPSGQPAKYALEVAAGFVKAKGIGTGWKMEL